MGWNAVNKPPETRVVLVDRSNFFENLLKRIGRLRCSFISLTGPVTPELTFPGPIYQPEVDKKGKKKTACVCVNKFKTHSSQHLKERGKNKSFFSHKIVFSSAVHLRATESLVQIRQAFVSFFICSTAAQGLLSDFVFVLMHSGAKILTSSSQQGSLG